MAREDRLRKGAADLAACYIATMTAQAKPKHHADDDAGLISPALFADLTGAEPSDVALEWVRQGLEDADADPRRRSSSEVASAIAQLHSETMGQRGE